MFLNIKKYDACQIVQKLSQFDFTINVLQKRLEKHMGFNLNNELVFQFLSFFI